MIENKPVNVLTTQKYTEEQLQYFRENYPYTENGFFSLKGYIEEAVGIDWYKRSFSMIIQAERNMGKSFGTWDFIEKEIWIKSGYTERIAYLRTNLTKLKPVKSFFNSKYKGKYIMTDTHIWKIELDEKGKEIKENRIELGAVIGVMNEENFRSGEFANYRMIFWDEYNETTLYNDIFTHWVNLYKTIERMTPNFFSILVGNKINANNDILVNLEIEVPNHAEQKEDTLIVKQHPFTGEDMIYFIDIAPATFAHLNQKGKSANAWAAFSEETNRFMNEGGYLTQQQDNVLIYRTRIKPSAQVLFYMSWGEYIYEYGCFDRGLYFHKVEEYDAKNYRVLSLDVLGDMYYEEARSLYSMSDYEELAQNLAHAFKNRELFFSSFTTKNNLEKFIIKYTSLII